MICNFFLDLHFLRLCVHWVFNCQSVITFFLLILIMYFLTFLDNLPNLFNLLIGCYFLLLLIIFMHLIGVLRNNIFRLLYLFRSLISCLLDFLSIHYLLLDHLHIVLAILIFFIFILFLDNIIHMYNRFVILFKKCLTPGF